MKIKSLYTIFLTLLFSISLYAVPPGGFGTLMVQAKDIDKYVDYLKENIDFSETESLRSGYCKTRTGQNYSGQMFVWNAFESMEKALNQIEAYDPSSANFDLAQLRKIKYNAIFKSLKDFEPRDGYHRLWRMKLNNSEAFTDQMTILQKQLQDAGHDMIVGVFNQLGGGFAETGMFHVRTITATAAETGKVVDDYYEGASWRKTWDDAQQYVDEIVDDTVEYCETIYLKE